MSSLTSIGINKNKKGFAPKIAKRKERKPAPAKASQAAESSTKSKSTSEPTIPVETLRLSPPPTHDSVIDSVVPKSESLTQEELAINSLGKRRRRPAPEGAESSSHITEPTAVIPTPAPVAEQQEETGSPSLKAEVMTPHFEDILDNNETVELKEEEEKSSNKELLKKRKKGKEKATPRKKPAKKVKTSSSQSKGTAISIGIGVPGPSTSSTTAEVSSPQQQEESDSRKEPGKKRNRFAYRLVENMKTLDDITNDPANTDALDKPMAYFTKDIDGVVSKAFKEMETAREEELKKKEAKKSMNAKELDELREKEAEEERIAAENRRIEKQKEEEKRKQDAENHVIQESSNAVQVRIVNGEIVLDTDTLVVERQSGETQIVDESMEIVEETNMTRKVNSGTYSKRKQSSRWDAVETATFFDYLSQFGTDFEMISKMMPTRTRNQIRLKFNREERLNPEKVTEYLITRKKPMDLEKFKEVSGIDLEIVPDDFHELQLK